MWYLAKLLYKESVFHLYDQEIGIDNVWFVVEFGIKTMSSIYEKYQIKMCIFIR